MYKKYIVSLFLLMMGALIYVLFRQNVLFLLPVNSNFLAKIKIELDYSNLNFITYWLIYCFPDSLWYAALLIIQMELCSDKFYFKKIFLLSVALPFLLELCQGVGVMLGTFDLLDILTYLLTLIFFMLCQKKAFFRFLY